MFHFTFIDEASTEIEKKEIKKQENILDKKIKQSNSSKNFLQKTVKFLHQNIDPNNNIRLFIKKE